jgi:hypothetical protein
LSVTIKEKAGSVLLLLRRERAEAGVQSSPSLMQAKTTRDDRRMILEALGKEPFDRDRCRRRDGAGMLFLLVVLVRYF